MGMLDHIMRRFAAAVIAVLAFAGVAEAQLPPPTLPASTVWGRLGIGPGPGQAIPFSIFASNIAPFLGFCNTLGGFPTGTGITLQCSTVAGSQATLNGGPLTINPTIGTTNQGFIVGLNQSGFSGSQAADLSYNTIGTIFDAANITTGSNGFTYGLSVSLNSGGANAKGNKYAFNALVAQTAGGTSTGADLVAVGAHCLATTPNGGTGGSPAGTCYGMSILGQLTTTATNYFVVSGGEVDAVIGAGASASHRWGWSLIGGGALQGTVSDGALQIGAVNASGEWGVGILFSKANGFQPILSSGTLIGTDGQAATVTNGIDFSAYTITGNLIMGPSSNFLVNGTGGISGTGLSIVSAINNGLVWSDGTVTGKAISSALFTHSVAIGSTSNHNLVFLQNGATAGWFDTSKQFNLGGVSGIQGVVILNGSSSGAVTQTTPAAAGTPIITWGSNTGTPAVTASSPLVLTSATGNLTCPTCASTSANGTLIAPQGRITLTANTPIMTVSATAQTTLRYDCSVGSSVPYFDGTNDLFDAIASCEVTSAMQASSTGVLNANGVFDVWWVHSGANRICVATNGSGGGWASDTGGSNTARGTGYSQLDFVTRGYITNKNALASCYNGSTNYGSVPINRATYLGTICTDAAAAGSVSYTFGSSASGGGTSRLCVWNYYNRRNVQTYVQDNTPNWSWTSASATPLNVGGTGAGLNNRVIFVSGVAEDSIGVRLPGAIQASSTVNSFSYMGFALNSTTTLDRLLGAYSVGALTINYGMIGAEYAPQVGLNFIQAMQQGDGTHTSTTYGNSITYGINVALRM